MTKISANMLNDTLNLIALARQTALAKGDQAKAETFSPVEGQLRDLVTQSRQAAPSAAPVSTTPSGALAQSDFKALLEATREKAQVNSPAGPSAASALERNQVVAAMAAGGMTDVEIARQMGMARQEVHLILNLGRNNTLQPGGLK